jgi:hypothetical protein
MSLSKRPSDRSSLGFDPPPPSQQDKYTSTLLDRQSGRKAETEFAIDKEIANRVPAREMTLEEFKKRSLPAIRIGKLKKIQALVRGWYARKYIVPLKRLNHYAAHRVVNRLMDEWVELHFLPEIILEIIQQNQAYRDYTFYSPDGRIIMELADELQNSLVHRMCEEVVRDISRALVGQYVRSKQEKSIFDNMHLPQNQLAAAFVTTVTDKMLQPIVKLALSELAEEYIVDVEWVKMLEFDFLPAAISDIIDLSGWEMGIELTIEDAIDSLSMVYIMDIIVECVEMEKMRIDEEAVETAFQAVLSRCILNSALEEAMRLDDQMRREEDEARGIEEEASRVEDEELELFNMDSPSKQLDYKPPPSLKDTKTANSRPIAGGTSNQQVASQKPSFVPQSRPTSKVPNSQPQSSQFSAKPSQRDHVDRSQLVRLLADKGWSYDPNAVSKSSVNFSRRQEPSPGVGRSGYAEERVRK